MLAASFVIENKWLEGVVSVTACHDRPFRTL
jgi:hypothetical protein